MDTVEMGLEKPSNTKELIISTALAQSVTVGLESISLGKLATKINMSKSGLFAHFKSKGALQLAVVEAALDLFQSSVIAPAMAKPTGLPRLHALFEHYLNWMSGSSGLETCPFTVFIQEYDSRPSRVRDILVQSELQWRNTFSKIAAGAINKGHISTKASPEQIAFELIGIAFSYQVSLCLLNTTNARLQAEAAFERIVNA